MQLDYIVILYLVKLCQVDQNDKVVSTSSTPAWVAEFIKAPNYNVRSVSGVNVVKLGPENISALFGSPEINSERAAQSDI